MGEERGQSLVEMALILPILLLLVVGIVDLGRAFNNHVIITNAAREGARYASRYPWAVEENGEIRRVARQEATASGILPEDIVVLIDPEAGYPAGVPEDPTAKRTIKVTAEYEFQPILLSFLPLPEGQTTIMLRSSTSMIVFGVPVEDLGEPIN
jgi:hypothetical protein